MLQAPGSVAKMCGMANSSYVTAWETRLEGYEVDEDRPRGRIEVHAADELVAHAALPADHLTEPVTALCGRMVRVDQPSLPWPTPAAEMVEKAQLCPVCQGSAS